jgi:hypothetical protein
MNQAGLQDLPKIIGELGPGAQKLAGDGPFGVYAHSAGYPT